MKHLFVIVVLFVFALVAVPTVFADGSCQPIYGGGQTCTSGNISLSKSVRNPQTNVFVHDLGLNDAKYHAGDLASFQLVVTNNGNATLNTVTVKDTLPDFLSFDKGPGSFDNTSKTLTFTINNLQPGQSQTFLVTAHVVAQNQLPANQSTVCIVNQATATSSEGQTVNDNSQLCIEKITATPSTGPEALGLLALFPTGLAGFFIRKSARK